ncbi:MAG: hypothetical protein U9O97_02470 [Elusimicrobiota bacterium]|nr:hypothetical protein [Elusimicrobiota bacterium]
MDFVQYYKNPVIRERIGEYCGGDAADPDSFTSQYLVGYGLELLREKHIEFMSAPKKHFDYLLERSLDIYRSVWDVESTLGVLDIEYFNIDNPGKVYTDPEEIFTLMEPAYIKIREVFARFNIIPLTIMTGQGYHFSFKISRFSAADKKLEKIGFVSDNLKKRYQTMKGRRKRPVSIRHGKAFDGMGKALEYAVHMVIKELAEENFAIPCVITDVAVGKSSRGQREALSFDLSMYGDPIFMRDIRCPFSTHQKHKMQWYKVGKDIAENLAPRLAIPRNDTPLKKIIETRTSPKKTIEYAKTVSCKIPDFSKELLNLLTSYEASKMGDIHRDFDGTRIHTEKEWPATYDALDPLSLPECTRLAVLLPNDNMLRPTNIQNLVRVLMFQGWHPKHIAGLITSKYARKQYNWTENWEKYDPASRANFYVRIFSDLLLTGLDGELDLNCVSAKEMGFCLKEWCGWNLSDFKLQK